MPPFDDASARVKVRLAEDAWNSSTPEHVLRNYTPDSLCWHLRHDDRLLIVAVDGARRERLKLWGHVRMSEDLDIVDLLNSVDGPPSERAIVFRIVAFDWNCPRHIPDLMTDAERGDEIMHLHDRIACLERRLARQTACQTEMSV